MTRHHKTRENRSRGRGDEMRVAGWRRQSSRLERRGVEKRGDYSVFLPARDELSREPFREGGPSPSNRRILKDGYERM